MTQVITQTAAAGVVNRAQVYMVVDGTAAQTTLFNVGFKPRFVQFVNITDRITDEWYAGMAADSAIETAANGTRTLETSGGITVPTTAAPYTVTTSTSFGANGTIVGDGVAVSAGQVPTPVAGDLLGEGWVAIDSTLMVASKTHCLVAVG